VTFDATVDADSVFGARTTIAVFVARQTRFVLTRIAMAIMRDRTTLETFSSAVLELNKVVLTFMTILFCLDFIC
jgi:hypothetical protein